MWEIDLSTFQDQLSVVYEVCTASRESYQVDQEHVCQRSLVGR
jgi:hypothetical protein